MCGIAGYYLTGQPEEGTESLAAMLEPLAHRGPDDEGMLLVESPRGAHVDLPGQDAPRPHRIAFGHRRFAIVDLSSAGHQPMWSAGGEVCVALNGEIYNFVEVREELATLGHTFRTATDTEVLLRAYLAWGSEAFSRLNGTWALSLYDARDGSVLLARDRIGEIPLYYRRTSEGLFWASEIKALRAVRGSGPPAVDEQSVTNFVRDGARDVDQRTFYAGISRFPSASWAKIRPDASFEPQRFWDLPQQRREESEISVPDARAQLLETLSDAVRIRLRVDVPLAFELSGGMDSSTLVALGLAETDGLAAYTVSFPGTSMDEEPYAREVARTLGPKVEYNVLQPENSDFFESADAYVALMDEPFHFPGMLTNFQIWKQMHAAGVRVCINGGGGDELFAGYGGDFFRPFLRHLVRRGEYARALRESLAYTERQPWSLSPTALHARLRTTWGTLRRLVRGGEGLPRGTDPFVAPAGTTRWPGASAEFSQRMIELATDARMNYWLASDNQSYMGIPIELRLPFLDYRLIEFAFTLPATYLIRGGWLKWILRESVRDRLPPEVVWRRRKMGFPFPLREWLPGAKEPFFRAAAGAECPYVDERRLRSGYELMARRTPALLWREMALVLWWKRCVLGLPLG